MELSILLSQLAPYIKTLKLLRAFFADESAKLLAEIGGIHLKSYSQAIDDANRGDNFAGGMLVAIGHLRDSLNFFEAAAHKRRLRLFRVRLLKRTELFEKTVMVAVLIALAYKMLGDHRNYRFWREQSFVHFEKYSDLYIEMGVRQDIHAPEDRIQTNYAHERTETMELRRRELVRTLEELPRGD